VSSITYPSPGGAVRTPAFVRWLRDVLRHPIPKLLLLLAGDTLATAAALLLALWLWTFTSEAQFGLAYLAAAPRWMLGLIPAWLFLNLPLYDLRRAANRLSTARSLALSAGVAALLYFAVFFFFPRDALPRLVVLYFVVGALALTLAWRLVYNGALESALLQRRLIVVGAGWSGRTLLHAIRTHHPRHWAVVGLIDDAAEKHGQVYLGVPVLGGAGALVKAARQHAVTDVVLAISGELRGETFQALLDCQAASVPVMRMPALFEQLTGRVPIDHIDSDWANASFIEPAQQRFWYALLKRGVDLAGALAGLMVMALLWPFIGLAIWLEDGRPVFFRQTRLGAGGQHFEIFKFRTMVPEAEVEGPRWASRDDERITRVGWWLRRTRLDESPQFLNVLRGEMSLVGPRPERPEFTEQLEQEIPFFRARLLTKPGLTGWAQVNYGYAGTVADNALKLQWDLYYIKHQSLWMDLLIIIRTIPVIFGFRGT
jgi:exopolysaccharide biosynthesis polyprenyl glycosylphosphotransferase